MTTTFVTEFEQWPIELRLFLCSGWVVLLGTNFIFRSYIQIVHLPKMIRAFGESSYIVKMAALLENQGAIARRNLIDFLYGSIKYSPEMIERGYVFAQDVQNVPPSFKWLLYIQKMATRLSVAWALAVAAVFVAVDLWSPSRENATSAPLEDWYSTTFLIGGFAVILVSTASIGHTIYIIKKYFKCILKASNNCHNLSSVTSLSISGFTSKMHAPRTLYRDLFSPKYLSIGDITLQEIEKFPPRLLRLISMDEFLFKSFMVTFLAAGSLIPINPGI